MVKDFQFTILDAENVRVPLKMALTGASGDGKTYTALLTAQEMANGDMSKVLVIDSENMTSAKYRAQFPGFKIIDLSEDYDPDRYTAVLEYAQKQGFEVIITDSLSHAWAGKGGALEQVDKAAAKYRGNSYAAFAEITPKQNRLIDAILQCKAHLIVTMRSKTDYVLDDQNGKKVPRKIGTKPIQRDGMDYEFDVVLHMEDAGKRAIVTKTRCSALAGEVLEYPGKDLAITLKDWLAGVDPETLPMSKTQFLNACSEKFGAQGKDIAAAFAEKGIEFSPEKAPELFDVVENYMVENAKEADEINAQAEAEALAEEAAAEETA